ncbi:Proteophosphoglycan 5, partial [Rhodotorula toruloides]
TQAKAVHGRERPGKAVSGEEDALERRQEVERPEPELSANFEWQPTFDELLEQTASTNVVDADWPILKDMIKHKLAEAISNFLAMGPPWPLAPEDALQARGRAYNTLDSFTGPPFTIQRLCELSLYPRRQYTSLPKYLRAVNRVLSVTSEKSAFSEDWDSEEPLASTSATTIENSLGVVSQGVVLSPAHPSVSPSAVATRRPVPSPSASPRASPKVVPLLSPIPWLRKSDTASANGDVDPMCLSSPPPASSPRNPPISLPPTIPPGSATDPQLSPPKALHETATPTGGLVDEVDPGSGGKETAEPVALSSATTLSPERERTGASSPGKALSPKDLLETSTLQQRFVRASSPKVEMPLGSKTGGNGAAAEQADLMESHASRTMQTDSDVPLEHAHRAYVASLASQLVPDALTTCDQLLSLALPSPSRPLTPLAIGHDERNIDFWDDRKVRECEKGASEVERWEMSKGQVEEVKRVRKDLADAVKEAQEVEETSLTADVWLFPPRLSDDLLLARTDKSRWETGMATFDPSELVSNLLKPLAEALAPDFDADLLALEQVPVPAELYDLKLVATPDQLAHVKETRLDFVQKAKEAKSSALANVNEQEWPEMVGSLELPKSPRIGSPPIFPRPKSAFVDPAADSIHAFLPSEVSAYPSSPRGADYLRAEWEREDALSLPPSSPPTSTRSEKVNGPQQVWSSSQVGELPLNDDLRIELPAFGREKQIKSAQIEAESWWEGVSAFGEDEDEVDQIDSDYEDDAPSVTTTSDAYAHGKRRWDVLSSDQTVGEHRPDNEGEVIAQARLPVPKLALVSSKLPATPTLPRPADFARKSGTPFAQSLLPGLRSLTIELSWQAWSLPPGQTLGDVLDDGGADFAAPDDIAGLLPSIDATPQPDNDLDLTSDALTISATCPQSSSDETLSPRIRAFGLDSKYLERQQPTVAESQQEVEQGFQPRASISDAEQDEAETGAAALLQLASSGSSASPGSPEAAVSPAHDQQPGDDLSHAGPSDDSSDFGFIFPSSSLDDEEGGTIKPEAAEMEDGLHVTKHDMRLPTPAHLDEPVASKASPTAEVAIPLPPASTWSMASALDQFLAARGAQLSTSVAMMRPAKQRKGSPQPETVTAPQQRSSPPPGAIPFTAPPFIAHSSHLRSTSDTIRIVGFHSIFQLRSHFLALQQNGILPVHRPSRFPTSSNEIFEPHLIIHPSAAVLYIKLASLIGNAVPSPTQSTSTRAEPIFTTLARLSERFDRLVVILEEQQTRVGSVKSYSFTPPVLAALNQLATALSEYRDGQHGIELALSKGADQSAELTRRFVDWLRDKGDETEDLPVVNMWDGRTWLRDDPTEDEAALLQQPDLNELSASAILAIASLNDFLGMSASDRRAVFGSIVGFGRIDRISHALGNQSRPGSSASFKSVEFDAQPVQPLSTIAASGQDGLWDDEDDYDFSEFVNISQ